jgi:hypothetical protein
MKSRVFIREIIPAVTHNLPAANCDLHSNLVDLKYQCEDNRG